MKSKTHHNMVFYCIACPWATREPAGGDTQALVLHLVDTFYGTFKWTTNQFGKSLDFLGFSRNFLGVVLMNAMVHRCLPRPVIPSHPSKPGENSGNISTLHSEVC